MIGYLREVLIRFKYQLGGGSLLLILAGIIEHFTARSISWAVYIWLLAACFVGMLLRHGAEQHKMLSPQLLIRNLKRREWDRKPTPGVEYYFEILNSSIGRSVEHITVELTRMEPDPIGYLPAHLHIKHDNKPFKSTEFRFMTEFALHPRGDRQIDLITGPVQHSTQPMNVTHIVGSAGTTIRNGKYQLFVRASGKDTRSAEAVFEAWIDGDGALQCIQL
jgi:hypothetical protein